MYKKTSWYENHKTSWPKMLIKICILYLTYLETGCDDLILNMYVHINTRAFIIQYEYFFTEKL